MIKEEGKEEKKEEEEEEEEEFEFEFEYIVQISDYTYVRVQGHEMFTFQQFSRINTATIINNEEHYFQMFFKVHWVKLF